MSSGKFPAEYYKDMVENRYFDKVDRKDLGGVLRTFTPSAAFTIQSAFTTHEGRDTGIRKMFENLFENYKIIVHKDFTHVVDVESNACSGCYVSVTAQTKNELINGEKLCFCTTCGRVLYLAEEDIPNTRRTVR